MPAGCRSRRKARLPWPKGSNQDTSSQYTGKVTDPSGEALTGAVIRNVTDNTAIVADIDGGFTIKGKPGDRITISMVGFSPMDLTLGKERTLDIRMSENSEVLSEVVVVGYGTQKKISTTAAVSSLKPDEIAKKPVANITNSLAGRVAGVIAKQGSGEPGADGASLRIRGVGTLGNQNPLCVVDGVPRDFSKIDPNMIENITVLKDAAAVAPYGMAGANGVILVTNKKGSEGVPVLSYSGYVGFQNPTRITDQVNSYEYALMKNEAAMNAGFPNYYAYTRHDLEMFRKTVEGAPDADPDRYPDSNGLRDLIRGNSAITSHNLSLSGGTQRVNYFVSLGYLYQQGMWSTTDYQRFNLQSNLSVKATPPQPSTLPWADGTRRRGIRVSRPAT